MTRHFYSLLMVAALAGSALADDKPANGNVNANASANVNANANGNANANANARRGPVCYPGSVDTNLVPLRSAITPTVPSPTKLP